MKKHELIKEAYDRYPKGTKCKWHCNGGEIISTGIFHFNDNYILDSNDMAVFYGGEWAEIIPESILSGKVAVICTNPRQAKIIADHQNKKDVGNFNGEISVYLNRDCDLMPDDLNWDFTPNVSSDYKIIPFKDFAAEVGIKQPVFVMTSEDGVPLYIGDDVYVPQLHFDSYTRARLFKVKMSNKTDINSKFFSTKEAAEAWIKEQNKPKEVTVQLFNEHHSAKITKDWIAFRIGKEDSNTTTMIKPSDLEDMLHAYKSLQS